MTAPPIPCVFADGCFTPVGNFAGAAKKHYGEGEIVSLAPWEERSAASHAHYFASVHEAWSNLPEELAERFPTADHLRRYALIKAGFCDQRSLVCGSRAEAVRVAAFMRPSDEFAIVTVSEAVVTVYTAKSQRYRAMGKAEFQRSKDAVLEIVAGMIGVSGAQLSNHSTRETGAVNSRPVAPAHA